MSTIWLERNEKGDHHLVDDAETRVVVFPETPDHVKLPIELSPTQESYRVKGAAKLPCPVCSKTCVHYLLSGIDIRVAICFTHESPYMFYSLKHDED